MRGEVAATLDMEGKRRAVVEKHTFGGEDGVAVKMPTCSGELGEEDGGAGVGVVVTAESNLLHLHYTLHLQCLFNTHSSITNN